MEFVRYVNGVTVSEKELNSVKIITPEITEAVNEVRRRAENGGVLVVNPQKIDG